MNWEEIKMNITITSVIMYLVIYIILHSLIGWKFEKIKKELEEKPGNERLTKVGRKLKFLMTWFPAMFVIFIVIMFYFF